MSTSVLTSEKNLPLWCYGCGEKVTYTKKGEEWYCDECDHEYKLPEKEHFRGSHRSGPRT